MDLSKILRVTTPPRPTRQQVDTALARIAANRRRIDDPHQEMLSDEPWEVLAYLRKYSGREIPEGVRAEDVEDGLTLRLHLWWEGEAIEAWLLQSAEKLQMPRPQVAGMLGLRSGQGVAERLFRLGEKLNNRRPRRRSDPAAGQPTITAVTDDHPVAEPGDVLQSWLAERRTQLERYAAVLVDHKDVAGLSDETYAEVLALRDMTRDPGRGIPWFMQITDTTVHLSADPAVKKLDGQHPLRRTLARLDALSSQWAGLRRRDTEL